MAANGHVVSAMSSSRIHDISVEDINGHKFKLDRYNGKIMVIVNIASFGDDSAKVLKQMNEIQEKFVNDVAVLGFPCNQFSHSEHGIGNEILLTLRHVRPGNDFSPLFYLFQKVEVNGKNAHPLFKHLRETLPLPSDDLHSFTDSTHEITWSPICRNDVAKNFEKFIVAPNGKPYRRYSSQYQVVNLQNDVTTLLEKFNGHPSMRQMTFTS